MNNEINLTSRFTKSKFTNYINNMKIVVVGNIRNWKEPLLLNGLMQNVIFVVVKLDYYEH